MIVNRVKELRMQSGLSQQELANRIDAHRQTIVKLENGSQRLSDVWLQKISKCLGCQPFELITQEMIHDPSIQWVTVYDVTNQSDLTNQPVSKFPLTTGIENIIGILQKDSSMDKIIPQNAIVFIDPSQKACENGNRYLFNIDGEFIIRKFLIIENEVWLWPESNDPHFTPKKPNHGTWYSLGKIFAIHQEF